MSTKRIHHVFTCTFGDGVTATATLDLNTLRAGNGEAQYYSVEWEGERTDEHIPDLNER